MPSPVLLALLGISSLPLSAPNPSADDTITRILQANRLATTSPSCARQGTLRQRSHKVGGDTLATSDSTVDRRTGSYAAWSKTGRIVMGLGFNGTVAWQQDASGTVRPQGGGENRAKAISQAYRNADTWWENGPSRGVITNAGPTEDGGRAYDRLSVTPPGGQRFIAWFDARTHLLARTIEMEGAASVVATYDDYRPIAGCMIATTTSIDSGYGEEYRETTVVTKTTFDKNSAPHRFDPPRANPRDFSFARSGRTAVPFELVDNHVVVDAVINGRGPFGLILDTGGQTDLAVATATALGITAKGKTGVGGVGAGLEPSGYAHDLRIEIGGFNLKRQSSMVMDLPRSAQGRQLQGMLGYELLRRIVVEIDYQKSTLTLFDPKWFDRTSAGVAIPFDYSDHMPEIAGSFEGMKGRFRIDTGSGGELIISSPFAEQYHMRERHPRGVERVSGGGVGGSTTGYFTRSNDLTLGPIALGDIVTELSSQKGGAFADPSYTGNVGGKLLKRFIVTFDYPHQRLYLRPRTDQVADTGTFDRSGVALKAGAGGLVIDSVSAGTAADLAGVRAGDLLRSVDGVPMTVADLSALRLRFRAAPAGTVITLEILRAGAKVSKALTLMNRI